MVTKLVFKNISGGGLYTAHSLSWSRVKEPNPNGIMHAKVWIPEDPRANKEGANSSSSSSFNVSE
ncbi:unnamed protein product [Diabrotica balteata]|uniref:Uncharacterized protein n=1 Tax=Diabrotica balteata TaxID=107213 RepID=A0A9N9XDK6_DIABA|nr:unnamed protein product [Diabrotica balteata]